MKKVMILPLANNNYSYHLLSTSSVLGTVSVLYILCSNYNMLIPTECITVNLILILTTGVSMDPHKLRSKAFISDTNYPELIQVLQVKGLVPHDWPHFRCQLQVSGIPNLPVFLPIWLHIWEFPEFSPHQFDNSLEWLTELRKTLYLWWPFYDEGHKWIARWRGKQHNRV